LVFDEASRASVTTNQPPHQPPPWQATGVAAFPMPIVAGAETASSATETRAVARPRRRSAWSFVYEAFIASPPFVHTVRLRPNGRVTSRQWLANNALRRSDFGLLSTRSTLVEARSDDLGAIPRANQG
jgi:hypothetical protein